MSTSESLTLLIALAGTIGTGLATFAAFRSAAAAKEAQTALIQFETLTRRREAVSLLGDIRRERAHGQFLVKTLRILYRNNAIFASGLGGSRDALKTDGLDGLELQLSKEVSVAEPFDATPQKMINLPDEDIERLFKTERPSFQGCQGDA